MSKVKKLESLGTGEPGDNPNSTLMKYRKLLCTSISQNMNDFQYDSSGIDLEPLQVSIKCFHHCLKEFPSMFAFQEPGALSSNSNEWKLSAHDHHALSLAFSSWSLDVLLRFLSYPSLQTSHGDIKALIRAILKVLQARDVSYFASTLGSLVKLLTALHSHNSGEANHHLPDMQLFKPSLNVSPESLKLLSEEERLDLPELPEFFDNPERCPVLQVKLTEILCSLCLEISQFCFKECQMFWVTLCLQIETSSWGLKKVSLETLRTLVKVNGVPTAEDVVSNLLMHLETLLSFFCSGSAYKQDIPVDLEVTLATCCVAFFKACLSTIHVFVFNSVLVHTVLECLIQSLLKFHLVHVRSQELQDAIFQSIHLLLRLLSRCDSHCQIFLQEQIYKTLFTLLGNCHHFSSLVHLALHMFHLTLEEDLQRNRKCELNDHFRNATKRQADGTAVATPLLIKAEPRLFTVKIESLKRTIFNVCQEIRSSNEAKVVHQKLQGITMAVEIVLKASMIQAKFLSSEISEISQAWVPASLISQILETSLYVINSSITTDDIYLCLLDLFILLLNVQDLLSTTLPLLSAMCVMTSAPWIAMIKNGNYYDLKSAVFQENQLKSWRKIGSKGKAKSLSVLALLPAPISPFWRLAVINMALINLDEQLQAAALSNLPSHLCMLDSATTKCLQDLFNSLRSVNSSPVQRVLAKVIGPLHCLLSGTLSFQRPNICLEDSEYNFLLRNLTCKVCDKEEDFVKKKIIPDWLQDMLLKSLSHPEPEVRKNAVSSCKHMLAHTRITADVLLKFLSIIEDPDYNIQEEFSNAIKYLLKNKDELSDNLNDCLAMRIRQTIVKAQLSGDVSLLECLLNTVHHLGQTDSQELLSCALFTFLEYLQSPSPVLSALARWEITQLAKYKGMHVQKFFRLHWKAVCKYVVKDMLDEKNEDPLALSYKITNLCEYSDIKIFFSNTIRFILPAVVSSQSAKTSMLIKALAKATKQSKRDLLTKNFAYVFSDLVQHCTSDVMLRTLDLVQKLSNYDLATLTRLNLQRMHNELLLHLSTHQEKVFSAISFLAGKDQEQGPADIADVLEPRILAFLVFFDTQLLNPTIVLAEKKLALKSLIAVMNLMGPKHITIVRMKVMATLKIALRITQEDFPEICCEAWSAFVRSIELPSLGPMLNQVLATLLVLLKLEPELVAKVFHFLIVENRENLKEYFNDLYFVPEMTELSEVNAVLRDYTQKPDSQSDFCSLLVHSQNGLTHESLDVRIHALVKLKNLLNSHQSDLHAHLLTRESVDPVVSQLVTTLMSGCRETDMRVRLLSVEILGELGAIDPGRLELKSVTTKENARHLYSSVDEENFAYALIIELVHSFLAADDCRIQDCACYALQEMLRIYDCEGKTDVSGKKLWDRFSPDVKDTLKPYFQSRYIKASDTKEVTYRRPICNSRLGSTFKDWIRNWTTDLLGKVQDEKALSVFGACSKILQHCTGVALYLLPQILVYVLKADSKEHTEEVFCEIVGVLKLCEDSEVNSRKSSKSDLIHMSAQVVFTSLDHLRQWCQIFGKKGKGSPDPTSTRISKFLDEIPLYLLSKAAFNCQAYTRALMYLELLTKENPKETDKHLGFLQKLYAALDEPDGVSGVSAVRKNEPTLKEQILEHETTGQLQDAFACYERSLKAEEEEVAHHRGLLRCLMGLDQAQTALTYATGILNKCPQWHNDINPYRVEAAWKLGSWEQLSKFLTNDLSSENWGLGVGKLLNFAVKTKNQEFFDQLKNLRIQLTGPLSAAAMENGAYQRGYTCLIKLHMLSDIQKGAETFLGLIDTTMPISSSTGGTSVPKLLEEWRTRRKFVQSSMRFQEPILNIHRVLLLMTDPNHPVSTKQYQQEMTDCWLQSAKLARRNNHQQRAYSCLLESALRKFPQLFMERAKLLWNKGDQQQAIVTLQKGIQEEFPVLIDLTHDHKKLCAKSKLMLAQYSEESSTVDSNSLISMYKEVVSIQPDWEESHFHLAKYYDRVIPTIDKTETKAEIILNIIKHFGQSLQYGCAHIYHSMPRLLALWFDLGSQVADMSKVNSKSPLHGLIDVATKYVSQLKLKLPAYHFLTAFPQLISRICHSHPGVAQHLQEIIAHILVTYPLQAIWMMTAVSKSSYRMRVDRCQEVFQRACRVKPNLKKFIMESLQFADMLLELSNKQVVEAKSFSINLHFRSLPKFLDDRNISRILLPLQSQMTATLPTDITTAKHNPFPQNLVYIDKFVDMVEIMVSLQKPKKVTIRGSDGKLYPMMCKPKDDLRKDCRLMEFNNLVNKYLRKDSETRRRQLHIRTYTVVPLNEECGLIEWVPNLTGLRIIINNIFKEKGIGLSVREIKQNMPQLNTPVEHKLVLFKEKFLAVHPPVFSEWFFKTFADPTAWYMAKLSYARTLAVMSMVGYILGLGDRHGENILFDSSCGDTIHVDFNCLFNKGETFDWPERVPFRLTHNMIAALGPLGTEGVYRKACEATMRVMRNQTDTLMSVLKPFIHDPLVEWGKTSKNSARSLKTDTGEIENEKAVSHVRDIEHRLQGIIMKGKKKSQGLPLSIEGQVNFLIQEATNEINLCQMYIGWAAYM